MLDCVRKLIERDCDPYKVLGVDASASVADITRAFRRRALVEHPDRGGDPEAFLLLNEAREVLLDPVRRAEYDRVKPPADRSTGGSRPTARQRAAADPFGWEPWPYPGRPASYNSGRGPGTDSGRGPGPDSGRGPGTDSGRGPGTRSVRLRAERSAWWKPVQYAMPGQGRHRRADPINRFAFLALLVAAFVPLVGAVLATGVLVQIRQTGTRGAWAAWLAIVVSAARLWGVSMFPVPF
jgi:curved DNA-binding protein CbpA